MLMARHLGWLHSVPEESKQTRGQMLASDDERTELPKPEGMGHLFELMCDAGWCGMGPTAMGYPDLKAWSEACGISLTGWEFETMRRMSDGYVGMLIQGRQKDCLPPFAGSGMEQARKRAQSQFQALFNQYNRSE